MDQKYDSDVHWMLKLAANEDARLRNELEETRQLANDFRENNKKLSIQIISLEQQLDNALQLCNQLKDKIAKYEAEATEIIVATRQEIVTQPSLFSFEEEKHKVKMQPTRRALTTEQAQHAYNMVSMGNARITDMAKKFGCHDGTIANIISGISYKEIVRKD
jgi:chromosome segregation ATPase